MCSCMLNMWPYPLELLNDPKPAVLYPKRSLGRGRGGVGPP